jgi:hypothetical protein
MRGEGEGGGGGTEGDENWTSFWTWSRFGLDSSSLLNWSKATLISSISGEYQRKEEKRKETKPKRNDQKRSETIRNDQKR